MREYEVKARIKEHQDYMMNSLTDFVKAAKIIADEVGVEKILLDENGITIEFKDGRFPFKPNEYKVERYSQNLEKKTAEVDGVQFTHIALIPSERESIKLL